MHLLGEDKYFAKIKFRRYKKFMKLFLVRVRNGTIHGTRTERIILFYETKLHDIGNVFLTPTVCMYICR